MKTILLTAAVACALMATPAHARETSLPKAMLGNWCPIENGAHVYARSADRMGNSDQCMTIKADGYELATGEDSSDFVRIQRKGDSYVVAMKYFAAGDCEFTSYRRRQQCMRNRPIHTSVFRLDREHLSIKE